MDSCIISLSTEVSHGRGKGRETLGVDMFSYEIGDSGHANGFPLKKKKKKGTPWCLLSKRLVERLVVPFKRVAFSEDTA